MKNIINIAFLFIGLTVFGQVTIVVEELPEGTPKDVPIYVSGDFEGWTGGNEKYQLKQKDGVYSITLPQKSNNVLFKFTQGTWKTAECDANGKSIDNRIHNFNTGKDTIKVKIAGWSHLFSPEEASTASKNVTVLTKEFEIPELHRKRTVRLYLPPNYNASKKSYPVVYMHDAQNLFDKKTSFSGEWEVDETLNKLFKDKNLELIVVGIDNGGKKRLDEYSPWTNNKYGGGEGDAYLDFVVKKLKPYIDKNYRTIQDKSNTGIIGSSMGGLISHYAALKYPKVFGKVGVFSPAFWFTPEVKEYSQTHGKLKDTKMYFLAGAKEGNNVAFNEISQTAQDMNAMVKTLKEEGFNSENIKSKVVPEGKHDEKLWRTNFEEAIAWLFKDSMQPRTFVGATYTNNQLNIKVSDGAYKMQFYAPEISETTFVPKGEKETTKASHAVVLTSAYNKAKFVENDKQIEFKTNQLSIVINKQPFKVSYWYKGKKVTEEKNGYQKNDDYETLRFALTPEEVLYGGGARALGMNRRGNRLELYNKAHYGYEDRSKLMNFSMPLVLSSKKYAIHFDNAPIGYLDLDSYKDNALSYETISGRKTYQVIVGESWLDLIGNYTQLTGKQPMLPRWALGNFSSRFGYHSQKETENTITKFKEEEIPVDAIILDLYWFGKDLKGTMGNLEVYKDSFPDMKQMVQNLKNKGVKTVLITEPFVLSTSKKWKDAVAKDVLAKDSVGKPARYDFYFGNTGIVDIYKKEGRTWFWNIYKGIKNMGVQGFWGDLGEPEVHPSWVQHATGTADEVHNIYGHDWARLIAEGFQKEYPNERPFILMRAGYSGSQRFGLVPWSGDVNRTWGGLQSQPEISLQMGMQGIGYMHSDLGGFAGANLDDELYTRWLQYGVFQPIFRPHAQEEVPSEPVFRSEKAKELAKQSIELRYKLLPYNYHLVYENSQFGKPLMRPLFFENSANEELQKLASTYLWGNDFLITPILNSKVTKQEVYFPKNAVWFDFYTDEKVIGGQKKQVATKINAIPTYVRAGAFIPMTKLVQSTDSYKGNNLEIHYYHDRSVKKSKRNLYNDDGMTANAIQKNQYELLSFDSEFEKDCLTIQLKDAIGKEFKVSKKSMKLIVHNVQKAPKEVKIGRKKQAIVWNQTNKSLLVSFDWNTKKTEKITIKL
ncbi:TIM-barrel domain-containing protein [uncultured Tenacibaculum sp.]|uniref:TIM-barrel domain-containing protein n=1 Tax=uncultured Tenacibaculum sp. TaxID=174713 RepID=UPI00260546D7|nr:TIM-barrel domain-containing protein [uncultured Tenacibaculum sp.]